jgi:hypothetical protein
MICFLVCACAGALLGAGSFGRQVRERQLHGSSCLGAAFASSQDTQRAHTKLHVLVGRSHHEFSNSRHLCMPPKASMPVCSILLRQGAPCSWHSIDAEVKRAACKALLQFCPGYAKLPVMLGVFSTDFDVLHKTCYVTCYVSLSMKHVM